MHVGKPPNLFTKYNTGTLEVAALNNYINCFPTERRVGRFFRKLTVKSTGGFCSTEQVIGKNTTAKYGKEIANLLHLEAPDSYTGHTWRRTSITFMANAGMSLPQIKSVSGHKSDTVVQGYIDKSEHMQTITAETREVKPRHHEELQQQIKSSPQPTTAGATAVWSILSNVTATTINVYVGNPHSQTGPTTSHDRSPAEPVADSSPPTPQVTKELESPFINQSLPPTPPDINALEIQPAAQAKQILKPQLRKRKQI